jgi:hypothetical protein
LEKTDCLVRLGLSIAVIALVSVTFYQFSSNSRPSIAVAPPMITVR